MKKRPGLVFYALIDTSSAVQKAWKRDLGDVFALEESESTIAGFLHASVQAIYKGMQIFQACGLSRTVQAFRKRGEAIKTDEASKINGASEPPCIREFDLVSICEAYVARSVATKGVLSAVGGASSAAGSGRGPPQTNVLLRGAFDPTWYLASAKIAYRMERFRQSIGRCYLEFCGCYFRACWVCFYSLKDACRLLCPSATTPDC